MSFTKEVLDLLQLLPITLMSGCEYVTETVRGAEEHRQAQQVVFDLLVAPKLPDLVQNIVKIHSEVLIVQLRPASLQIRRRLIALDTKE